jgi:hypothetical protein
MEMLTSSLSTLRLHYLGVKKKIVCDKAMVLVWCVQQLKKFGLESYKLSVEDMYNQNSL